jgi:hypothetical protein
VPPHSAYLAFAPQHPAQLGPTRTCSPLAAADRWSPPITPTFSRPRPGLLRTSSSPRVLLLRRGPHAKGRLRPFISGCRHLEAPAENPSATVAFNLSRRRLSVTEKESRSFARSRGSRRCRVFASPTPSTPARPHRRSATTAAHLFELFVFVIVCKLVSLPLLDSSSRALRSCAARASNRAPQFRFAPRRRALSLAVVLSSPSIASVRS